MSTSSSVTNLVLFFALVCQIPAASSDILSPFRNQGPPVFFTSSSTIETPFAYQFALRRFREAFTLNSTKSLCAHPLLPDSTKYYEAPYMWIPIILSGWDDDEVTLLFRNDNMELAGFANKSGTWFAFVGYEHLIPGAIPAGIRANFLDLVGGWQNLDKVPLGKNALRLAVRNLSSGFDPSAASAGGDMDRAKVSVAQLLVMFPGALRFFPVRQKVMDGWESGSLLEEMGERALLLSWKDIAVSLKIWNETKQWEREPMISRWVTRKYKIESAQDALRLVDLLVVPHRYGF